MHTTSDLKKHAVSIQTSFMEDALRNFKKCKQGERG